MFNYNPRDQWKKIVLESRRKIINEAEENIDPDINKENSVDRQIDEYLSSYESDSKVTQESILWSRLKKRLLLEKDGEEEDDDSLDPSEEDTEEEEGGEEGEEEDTEGDEESPEEGEEDEEEEEEPEKLTSEDIDLNAFASKVSRLVDNYESLLEIKNVILRRALKYLDESYDKSALEEFKDILLEEYGLEIGETPKDMEEKFQSPPADRALGGGDGGGGGGGI
jgi:hypothetical protein